MDTKYALLIRDNDCQEWRIRRLNGHLHDLANEYKTYKQEYPDDRVIPVKIDEVSLQLMYVADMRHKAKEEEKMRVLKIEEGKATIEIDGDEMCIIREGLYSMKDKTCFGADRRDKLMNDISAIYSISTYHKVPQMESTPRVTLRNVECGSEAE